MKVMKEDEAVFKVQIEKLNKENALLRNLITKQVHTDHQAENARAAKEEVEQERSEAACDVAIHFDLTRSKIREPIVHVVNSRRAIDAIFTKKCQWIGRKK